jgi:carbon-monoxide dehydrogenase medium subunit
VLAGGHSLVPMMRFRFARPTALVDINGLDDLRYVRRDGKFLRIGSLSRHRDIQDSPLVQEFLPLLSEAAGQIGDNQIRNRGTIGGSIAHADPAAEFPTLCLMFDAEIVTNRRSLSASEFFLGLFTTQLEAGELISEIVFPVAQGPHRYIKFGHRLWDFAVVGVAAQETDAGWRIGIANVGSTPMRARDVERALATGASTRAAAEQASNGLAPSGDMRATPEFKMHLARVLTHRAIAEAINGDHLLDSSKL